jgi:hypothetical protein
LKGFSSATSTIGGVGLRIALSKLIKAARFSGVPKVFLKAKSLMGRIPKSMAVRGTQSMKSGALDPLVSGSQIRPIHSRTA